MKLRGPRQYYFDAISLHRHNKKLLINLMDTVVCRLSFISSYRRGDKKLYFIYLQTILPPWDLEIKFCALTLHALSFCNRSVMFFKNWSNQYLIRRVAEGAVPLLISDPSFFPDHRLKPLTLSEAILLCMKSRRAREWSHVGEERRRRSAPPAWTETRKIDNARVSIL